MIPVRTFTVPWRRPQLRTPEIPRRPSHSPAHRRRSLYGFACDCVNCRPAACTFLLIEISFQLCSVVPVMHSCAATKTSVLSATLRGIESSETFFMSDFQLISYSNHEIDSSLFFGLCIYGGFWRLLRVTAWLAVAGRVLPQATLLPNFSTVAKICKRR